jgi:hypothetical protein
MTTSQPDRRAPPVDGRCATNARPGRSRRGEGRGLPRDGHLRGADPEPAQQVVRADAVREGEAGRGTVLTGPAGLGRRPATTAGLGPGARLDREANPGEHGRPDGDGIGGRLRLRFRLRFGFRGRRGQGQHRRELPGDHLAGQLPLQVAAEGHRNPVVDGVPGPERVGDVGQQGAERGPPGPVHAVAAAPHADPAVGVARGAVGQQPPVGVGGRDHQVVPVPVVPELGHDRLGLLMTDHQVGQGHRPERAVDREVPAGRGRTVVPAQRGNQVVGKAQAEPLLGVGHGGRAGSGPQRRQLARRAGRQPLLDPLPRAGHLGGAHRAPFASSGPRKRLLPTGRTFLGHERAGAVRLS